MVFLEFLFNYIAEEFLENVFDLLQIFSLTDLFLIINPYIYIRECSLNTHTKGAPPFLLTSFMNLVSIPTKSKYSWLNWNLTLAMITNVNNKNKFSHLPKCIFKDQNFFFLVKTWNWQFCDGLKDYNNRVVYYGS